MRIPFLHLLCFGLTAVGAEAQRNQPVPEPYAVQNVRLALAEDAPLNTILLRDGRIEALLPQDSEVPSEYRLLDGTGLIALPAFVDAYSHAGLTMPEPWVDQDDPLDTERDVRVEMRIANRKGILPHWSAADGWKMERKASEDFLRRGIAGVLVAPHGELLAGDSALALMNGKPRREALLRTHVFAHAAFDARGDGYPGTLMAYHAQLRQFWMDARWQAKLQARRAQGLDAPRTPVDEDLEAGMRVLNGQQRLVCEADSARDIHRWLALADEFGFQLAIAGGRDAWQMAPELARRQVPVVLTLDWADEVPDPAAKETVKAPGKEETLQESPKEDAEEGSKPTEGTAKDSKTDRWTYTEPLALRTERRREWLLQRDNAVRLYEAGVPIYFGSGSESAKQLLERLGVVVEAGLPADEALQILSERTAEWLGATQDLGALAAGRAATFCLWKGSPFAKKSKVRYAFVEGLLSQWDDKDADKDADKKSDADGDSDAALGSFAGTWVLDFGKDSPDLEVTLKLEVSEEHIVMGTWEGQGDEGALDSQSVTGTVQGVDFVLESEAVLEGITVPIKIEGTWHGDELSGNVHSNNPIVELELTFVGQRQPQGDR